MAERTISTRLVLGGEKEYKSAVKQISAELTTLKSTMKLVDSEFKGQQNTMAALEAKNKALTDTIGKLSEKLKAENDALKKNQDYQKQAAQEIEATKSKIADKTAELEKLKKSSDDTTREEKELTEEIVRLNAELNKSVSAEQSASAAVEKHQTSANKAQTELNNLNSELEKNEKYLDEAKNSTDGCAKSIDEYGKETKEAAKESEDFGDKSEAAIDGLAQALAAAGVVATIKEITEALRACVDASIEYESAFAGVKKTVDATAPELAALSAGIKDMSTVIPTTTTAIAGVAEAAGQLGIQKSNILDFTETMVNLSVATNLSADAAASDLAKFANVVKMSPDNYGRLGSTIVVLGNNFATTEADIVSMATRLSSTGAVVGLSESQIMAVATAVSSLGIEAEAGGSAISKLLKQMETAVQTYDKANEYIKQTGMSLRELQLFADADGKSFKELAQSLGLTGTELKGYMSNAQDMENFSRVAGTSAEEFKRAWGQDAVRTLDTFISGLGKMDNAGISAVATLEDMGMTEIRLSNAVLSMASNGGILTKALDLSNQAWEENTALAKEAAQRYATTESKMQLYKNSVDLLRMSIGDQLTPALAGLAEVGRDVNEWVAAFVSANPEIVSLTTALLAAGAAFTGIAVAIPLVIKVFTALTAAMAANPWVLTAAAIGAVVAALGALIITSQEADTAAQNLSKYIEESRDARKENVAAIEEESDKTIALATVLNDLVEKEHKTAADKRAILSMVEDLNQAVPDLALAYDDEADALVGVADGATMSAEAIFKMAQAQAEQELFDQKVQDLTAALAEQITIEDALRDAKERQATAADYEGERMTALGGGLSEMAQQYEDATAEIATLTAAQEANGAEIAALRADTEGLAETMKISFEGMTEGMQAYAQRSVESMESVNQEMDDLEKAYREAYDEAHDSLTDTMGLFTEMDTTATTSVESMIKALDSQIKWLEDYNTNLDLLLSRDIDGIDELATNFMDGTTESAAALAGLKNATDDEVKEVVEKLKKSKEGTDAVSTNIASAKTDFLKESDEIINKVNALSNSFDQTGIASKKGAENIQAYIDGMKSKEGDLNATYDRILKNKYRYSDTDGSHASGLTYVPRDGYLAELHKGERVLTALEAKAYAAEQRINSSAPTLTTINNTQNVRNDAMKVNVSIGNFNNYDTEVDTRRLISDVSEEIAREAKRKAAVNR